MGRPAAKREAVAHLRAALGLSERRACAIVSADRAMIRYQSRRPPETELRTKIRDMATERKRFGYRRLFILLRQGGEPSGVNRIYRLYREEGLSVRKRQARRRAAGTRAPILVEAKANARWSLDFVHDQFASGRRFRVLNIVGGLGRRYLRVHQTAWIYSGSPAMFLADYKASDHGNAHLAGWSRCRQQLISCSLSKWFKEDGSIRMLRNTLVRKVAKVIADWLTPLAPHYRRWELKNAVLRSTGMTIGSKGVAIGSGFRCIDGHEELVVIEDHASVGFNVSLWNFDTVE